MTTKTLLLIKSKFEREFNQQETLSVLRHNFNIFASWGVSKLATFEGKALILKVNAHRHKAYVVITLAWNDTYSVYLINANGTIKKEFTEVYFDVLTETIDNEIERIPEYKD